MVFFTPAAKSGIGSGQIWELKEEKITSLLLRIFTLYKILKDYENGKINFQGNIAFSAFFNELKIRSSLRRKTAGLIFPRRMIVKLIIPRIFIYKPDLSKPPYLLIGP